MARNGRPIVGGIPDTSAEHQAVVFLDLFNQICSGTLISDREVLTAAHCVYGLTNGLISVGFGVESDSAVWMAVDTKWIHPDYDPNGVAGLPTNDIAIVRLSGSVPDGITPLPFLPGSMAVTAGDIGQPLEFVGFGVTDAGDTDSHGVKMTVTTDLKWICTDPGSCTIGNGYTAVEKTICTQYLPGGPCLGDSGGPAFILRDGKQYVAGVTSYGDQNCENYACNTKVDEFEAEIWAFIGGIDGDSCLIEEECQSGFCVDGVCCESACDTICNACNVPGSEGSCLVAPDGTECPDGDLCNGTETCQAGTCQPGVQLECDDADACTTNACDPAQGCIFPQASDGTECPDDNACNGTETCQDGICLSGPPTDCDDGNPCTQDSCEPQTGCMHQPVPDGTRCFNDNMCDGAELCQNGACRPGVPLSCDDGQPCTEDICDPLSGCKNTEIPDCGSGKSSGCGLPPGKGTPALLLWIAVSLFVLRRRVRHEAN